MFNVNGECSYLVQVEGGAGPAAAARAQAVRAILFGQKYLNTTRSKVKRCTWSSCEENGFGSISMCMLRS